MAMPQIQHADTTDEIDVTLPVNVPDLGVFSMGKADGMNEGNGLAD
jgi:hypothetical protein